MFKPPGDPDTQFSLGTAISYPSWVGVTVTEDGVVRLSVGAKLIAGGN